MKHLLHPLKIAAFMRFLSISVVLASLRSVGGAEQAVPTTFIVTTSIKNDTSPPLKDLQVPAGLAALGRREIDRPRLNPNRTGAMAAMFALSVSDTSIQSKPGPAVPIKLVSSSDGLGREFPDTQGKTMA